MSNCQLPELTAGDTETVPVRVKLNDEDDTTYSAVATAARAVIKPACGGDAYFDPPWTLDKNHPQADWANGLFIIEAVGADTAEIPAGIQGLELEMTVPDGQKTVHGSINVHCSVLV